MEIIRRSAVMCDAFTHASPIPVNVSIINTTARTFYLTSALLLALGIAAVCLRFVARQTFARSLWFDDWLALPALLLECAVVASVIWGTSTGSLRNPMFGECEPRALRISRQIHWALAWLSIFAIGFMKLSLLFFYRRLFYTPGSKGSSFDQDTKRLIVLVVLWTIGFGFATVFPCGLKMDLLWEPTPDGICYQQTAVLFAGACSDVIIDSLILLCPIPPLWATQMPLRQKMLVALVFLGSLPAIAIAICRAFLYYDFDVATYPTYMVLLNLIEVEVGLITCCLPTLWVYHHFVSPNRVLRKIKSSMTSALTRSGDHGDTIRLDSAAAGPPAVEMCDKTDTRSASAAWR